MATRHQRPSNPEAALELPLQNPEEELSDVQTFLLPLMI